MFELFIFIEMLNDRSTVHEFINLSKLLAFPGELTESTAIGKHCCLNFQQKFSFSIVL